jgi:hypothetical protein
MNEMLRWDIENFLRSDYAQLHCTPIERIFAVRKIIRNTHDIAKEMTENPERVLSFLGKQN